MVQRTLAAFLFLSFASAQSVQDFSRQAAELMRTQETLKAVHLLSLAVQKHPQSSRLHLQLGILLVRLGDGPQADVVLNRVLALRPDDAEALRYKAESRLMQSDLAGARKHLMRLKKVYPDQAAAYDRLASLDLWEERFDSGLRHAQKAVDLEPSSSKYRRNLATLLDLNHQSEEAFRQLKIALRLAPRDAVLLFSMATRRKKEKNYSGALEFAEMAMEIDSENPLYHNELADIYSRLGQPEKAQQHRELEQRLQKAFEDYIQAIQMASLSHPREASAFLQNAIKDVPQFLTGRLFLAGLQQRNGDRKAALNTYMEILRSHPGQPSALEQGAWIHLQGGHTTAARRLLRDLEAEGSPNRDLFEAYGRLVDGDDAGALDLLKVMEQRQPLNPYLLQLISHTLRDLGRREEAMSYLKKAGRLKPHDAEISTSEVEIRLDEVRSAMDQHKWRKARNLLLTLVGEGQNLAEIDFNLAYCRRRLGELDEAIEDFRRGLAKTPGADWARLNLATCLYVRTRYREALVEWRKLAISDPSPDNLFQLGLCYSQLNRMGEAESAFSRSLKLGRQTPDLYYNLGLARFRLGRQQEGLRLIEEASRHGYGPASAFLRQVRRYRTSR